MRTSRWWRTGAVAVLTAISVPAVAHGSTADDPLAPQPLAERTTVTVGISSRVANFLPLFLADELGEFDRENIDIEFAVQPATETIVLVANGELDASMATVNAGVFNLVASGAEIKFVFPTSERADGSLSGIWVRSELLGDDGFQPSDLDGATIATPSGDAGFASAFMTLQLQDEDPSFEIGDVSWQQLPTPDAAQALINGAIDGAQLSSPFWQLARDEGCCEFIDHFPTFPSAYIAFGPNLLADDELAMALLRPMARVVREQLQGEYWTEPELADAIATALEVPDDALAEAVGDVQFDADFEFDPDAAVAVQEYYFARGETLSYDEAIAGDDLFDSSYVAALLGEA